MGSGDSPTYILKFCCAPVQILATAAKSSKMRLFSSAVNSMTIPPKEQLIHNWKLQWIIVTGIPSLENSERTYVYKAILHRADHIIIPLLLLINTWHLHLHHRYQQQQLHDCQSNYSRYYSRGVVV